MWLFFKNTYWGNEASLLFTTAFGWLHFGQTRDLWSSIEQYSCKQSARAWVRSSEIGRHNSDCVSRRSVLAPQLEQVRISATCSINAFQCVSFKFDLTNKPENQKRFSQDCRLARKLRCVQANESGIPMHLVECSLSNWDEYLSTSDEIAWLEITMRFRVREIISNKAYINAEQTSASRTALRE